MKSFDNVVVGGGSAGAVVATRLAEDPDTDVLLLEAGPDWRSDEADAAMRSANFLRLVLEERFVWSGLTATLTDAQNPGLYEVGRGLGGGSTVNAQFWARPPLSDFDDWTDRGCDYWDGETMREYLVQVEADADFGNRPYHGADGPIPARRPREERGEWGTLDYAFREAATAAGHPVARDRDMNAPGRTGFVEGVYNRRGGKRITTNDAYLDPARDRENLTVRGEMLVDRVQFNGMSATGVTAVGPDGQKTYDAERVVLAAGAVYTPGILVRSGVGPPDDLNGIDVPVRSECPGLGRLLDHPQLSITFRLAPDARLSDTSGPSARTGVFWSSSLDEAPENDLHVLTQNYRGVGEASLETGGFLFGLTDVRSEGRVTVTETDPTAHPEVAVGMLSDERDRERVVDAVEHIDNLLDHPVFDDVIVGEPGLVRAPNETVSLASLSGHKSIERAVLDCVDSYNHPVGTCRMGDPSESETVVDPTGAVVGVEDLYVADASIMPDIVTVPTNYTVIAMAERIADLLRR